MTKSGNDFDHIKWKSQFQAASNEKVGFRELRAAVFQNTVKLVKNGGYYVDDTFINIPNCLSPQKSEYFDAPDTLNLDGEYQTKYSVINADCLETAEILVKLGFNPCVLNLASRKNPGGGVLGGAGAQEENLFRRSNLFLSLYQFAPYANEYGITRHEKSYPLNKNTVGIYSAGITVFRGSEKNGYCLLKQPYTVSFVTVPAINSPDLIERNGDFFIAGNLVEPTKEKIRTILRITGKYKHDCLVLGAFGCGAFANPPNHMAELFREVFSEKEFMAKFKFVVFAIFEDHNSNQKHNPNGNVLPFLDVFNEEPRCE
ncbi:MAG: hypothetical protein Pg6C_13860 [Treponemataceae bacterium]|nr:MAG: hypothetical protein Pg6C_13860 [Treponemataceae bacterium]